ncbi:hypothetical protein [Nocardioides sp. 1609]|uniref:hypothetical protein n=1 Tax=Nocardioides sp. 1609 TaxID=2508327 RepID=UPI00106F14C9|nr:hypothetical protein [Nocardioides sp. 1609]
MNSTLANEPPFALDGAVTAAKVRELIDVQTELKWLDYKSECDLNNTYDRVEFAKDSGAMCIAGGYRLVGVDNGGAVVGLTTGAAAQFDEANLRGKLDKYLGHGYDVRSAVHAVDVGNGPRKVAIVWIAPHPEGHNVFKINGDYTDKNGKQQAAFRVGEVYARHGSKSEPWTQADVTESNRNRDARARDAWRAEMAEEFQKALHAATSAAAVTAKPAAAYTRNLDESAFEAATTELLRRDDDVPVRTMFRSVQAEVRRLVGTPLGRLRDVAGSDRSAEATVASDELASALGRITTVAALALELERPKYFSMACQALAELYGWSLQDGAVRTSAHGLVPILWLRIAERLYAVGGLAVRLRRWSAVRELALLDVPGLGGPGERTWHRDALTQSSRADLFRVTKPDGSRYEGSLLMFARGVAAGSAPLHPDLPEPTARGAEDPLLSSICAFDLLLAIVAGTNVDAASTRSLFAVSYPNFTRFEGRYDIMVSQLLTDPAMRQALLEAAPDQVLARVLALVEAAASEESKDFWGWEGYRDQNVKAFITKYTT